MSEVILNFFKKCSSENGDKKVQCVLCEKNFKSALVCDLKQHLIKNHYNYINMSELEKKRNRRNKSSLWNHFKKTDCEYFAECNYCNKSFSYKTTIGNLKKHLNRIHPGVVVIKGNENSSKIDEESEKSDTEVINDEELTDSENKDDVWSYFEKEPSNRARCILCKETFNRFTPFLKRHMSEKHPKIVADLPSDSDDDPNCYTEVVYLEEEQPFTVDHNSKLNLLTSTPATRKRSRGSIQPRFVKRKSNDANCNVKNKESSDIDEDIDNFGRYVTGLLKKLPKSLCMQLQMDIINLIMKAKLNNIASNTRVASNDAVQNGEVTVSLQNNVDNDSRLSLADKVDEQ